jgi:hypothetical protein
MKKLFLTIIFLLPLLLLAQGKGRIVGTVTDAKSGEPLPGVNILLKGTYYGAATDFNGKFRIEDIAPGTYTVSVSLIGYKLWSLRA